jgi:hypothetical protein
MFDYAVRTRGVFHLWGHSKQFDELNAWKQLDEFFGHVARHVTAQDRLSNEELAIRSLWVPDARTPVAESA